MSDETQAEVDYVLQEQLNYLAKQARQATGTKIVFVTSIEDRRIQTAVSNTSDNSPTSQARVQTEVLRALVTTADAIMKQGTNGTFKLLIAGPHGVHTVDNGIESCEVKQNNLRNG